MAGLTSMLEEAEEPSSFDNQSENSTKARRVTDRAWESVKAEIEQLYVTQDHSLAVVMQIIKAKHGLKASQRKWKLKLKRWGFEKYLSTTAMKILVAKAERRALVEKKDTVFLHGKKEVTSERIELFKKRKSFREGPAASPSQKTPANVLYYTPCINHGADTSGDPHRRRSRHLSQKLITISEFRAHKMSLTSQASVSRHPFSAHQAVDISAINNTNSNHQYIDVNPEPKALYPASLSNDQAETFMPVVHSFAFKWETLVGYVVYFCRHWAWSCDEIRIMHPEFYSEVAKTIAQEFLLIAASRSFVDYLLDANFQKPELQQTNSSTSGALFTAHFHALFLDTNLELAIMSENGQFLPQMIAVAYEMLDEFFRLELDPSALQQALGSLALARVFEAREKEKAAEEYYHEALRLSTGGRDRLNIQLCYSKFLGKLKRRKEAIVMLIKEYTSYLSTVWPTPNQLSFCLFPSLDHDVLGALQSLQFMDADETFTDVRASLHQLLIIPGAERGMKNREEVLLEFMRLGAAYTTICWLEAADPIYELCAPRLEVFCTLNHAFERACAFNAFAKHYEMRGSSEDRLKQLKLAFRCIQVVHLYHDQKFKCWVRLQDIEEVKSLIGGSAQSLDEWRLSSEPPGPSEAHFEEVARNDPLLSRWMLGESFDSVLAVEMFFSASRMVM